MIGKDWKDLKIVTCHLGSGASIAAVKNADGTMSVEVTTAAGEKANLTLQRDENVVRALDAEGNLVAQYDIEK